MTPGTRLLNAARASTRNPSPRENLTERERELLDAVEALSDVRALYPAAHAMGDRVSVVYPPEMREKFATQHCKDFTGVITGAEFHTDGVDYRVTGEGDPDYTVVEAAFVHPAPITVAVGGVVDAEKSCTASDIRARAHAQQSRHDPFTPEERAKLATVEYAPGEPFDSATLTDKARREAIAQSVIRSKPGPEGGSCDIDYRAAALVLFNLLDDIDTLDDACRENDAAFRRLAMVRARRREDVGASFDGYTVAFIGEAAYAEGERKTSIADVQKTTFDPAVHGNGVPGFGPVTHTNTCVLPGRSKTTTHTDEHGVKTTETVDLRDPDDLHARFAEALGAEWRKLEGDKDVRHEWLAAFERAVEIAGEVWGKERTLDVYANGRLLTLDITGEGALRVETIGLNNVSVGWMKR